MKIGKLIRIFHQEYKNSVYLKKVLYSYLLVTCLIFILFSTMLFILTNKNYGTALEELQDQTITQAWNANQTVLKDLVGYCYNLLESAGMAEVLYGEQYHTATALNASALHNNICHASSLVKTVYFINFQTGTIIDQNGRVAFSTHTDQEIFEILSEMSPGSAPLFCYPRRIDYITDNILHSDTPVLTMVFYRNSSGALVLNLDYEAYRDMLALDNSDYMNTTLICSTGNVIYASDPALFGQDYSQNGLYQEILSASSNRGSFPYFADGSRRTVKYIKNVGLGITYVCTLDELLIYPGNALLPSLVGYTLLYLLLGLVLSLLLSWVIYNPLRQLKSYISAHFTTAQPEGSAPVNDFNYLSDAYQEVLNINTRLQDVSNAWQAEQHNKLLKYLLTDPEGVCRMYAAELESLNAGFVDRNYLVALLGIDPASLQTEMETEVGLLKYVIQNVAGELLSSAFSVRHIEMASPYVIFLLNFGETEADRINGLLRQAQDFILTHYHITFSAGIGETVQELTEISFSYESAREAYSQRFLTGNGSVHTAGVRQLAPVPDQQYPFAASDALIASIKSLSASAVPDQVHAFITAAEACSTDQILCFILQLSSSLLKLESSGYIETQGSWDYASLERSTLADIEKQLVLRCLDDIRQLSSIREASSERRELIDSICSLVEENIYNPDLSVVFLADQVHLSVNYLRNIFKESTGDSLSGYITQKKLKLICELLSGTDMPLSEISDKLGFSTKNYLFTFFKKHIGMTPNDYRRKYRET